LSALQSRSSMIVTSWLLITVGIDVMLSNNTHDFRSNAVTKRFRKSVFAKW